MKTLPKTHDTSASNVMDRSISFSSKIQLMCFFVTSVFLYAYESWTLTAELQRRLPAIEIRCYCKVLWLSCKDHFTNEEVCTRSSRQSDHMKTSWPLWRDTNWSSMDVSPVQQVWPKPSCKAQWKGEEDKADRKRGGKTTSRNGLAWSFAKSQRAVENRKMEETDCEIICDSPTASMVKG